MSEISPRVIMVTGANGALGSVITEKLVSMHADKLEGMDISCYPIVREHFDIRDEEAAERVFNKIRKENPEDAEYILINCAAMIGNERCEKHFKEAYQVNSIAPFTLSRAFNEVFYKNYALFAQISTDYVFSGIAGPYSETDETNPKTIYAHTKELAEEILETGNLGDTLILRLSFFPDVCNYDFAYINKLTSAMHRTKMAKLVALVACKIGIGYTGYLHLGGPDTTFYELAKASNPNVQHMDAPKGTPLDTRLSLTKLIGLLGEDYYNEL